jgi:hypothetical protein
MMGAHLQEAAIALPLLVDEDCLDRRLHVVVDAARVTTVGHPMGLSSYDLRFCVVRIS